MSEKYFQALVIFLALYLLATFLFHPRTHTVVMQDNESVKINCYETNVLTGCSREDSVASALLAILTAPPEDKCQNESLRWKLLYTDMHNSIMNGTLPPRYLVSLAPKQGLADRIGALPTHFLFSLLTKRALLFGTPEESIALSEVYDFPNLNFDLPKYLEHKSLYNLSISGYPSSVNDKELYGMFLLMNNALAEDEYRDVTLENDLAFGNKNISRLPYRYTNTPTVSILGNRGMSWKIFDNKYHHRYLKELEFERSSIFHCIFDFMLTLKPSSCNERCTDIKDKMLTARNAGRLVIGVQMRAGDLLSFGYAHDGNNNTLESADLQKKKSFGVNLNKFVGCTERISDQILRLTEVKPLIMIVSDSLVVREHFVSVFGSNVLTDVKTPIIHSSDFTSKPILNVSNSKSMLNVTNVMEPTAALPSDRKRRLLAGMKGAASDVYLLSHAHIHIISMLSGFGQKGAMLSHSKSKNHIFFGEGFSEDISNTCTLPAHIQPIDISRHYSGV